MQPLGGEERKVRSGESLQFQSSAGEIRRLRLHDDHIGVAFHGRVTGMTAGAGEHRRSLMPSWLEWLRARHGLTLLWGSAIYLFGLVIGVLRWWKRSP